MTFIWHVDNLVGSCEGACKAVMLLAKIHGPKLIMRTGRKHDYLGMDMDFRQDNTLGVLLIPYLKNVIAELPEIILGKSPTPAASHLFKIRDEKNAQPLE